MWVSDFNRWQDSTLEMLERLLGSIAAAVTPGSRSTDSDVRGVLAALGAEFKQELCARFSRREESAMGSTTKSELDSSAGSLRGGSESGGLAVGAGGSGERPGAGRLGGTLESEEVRRADGIGRPFGERSQEPSAAHYARALKAATHRPKVVRVYSRGKVQGKRRAR